MSSWKFNSVVKFLSISYASYFAYVFLRVGPRMFYVSFESSTICASMWCQTVQILDCLKGMVSCGVRGGLAGL